MDKPITTSKKIKRRKKKQINLRNLNLERNNLDEIKAFTFPKYYSVRPQSKDIDNNVNSSAVDRDDHSNIETRKNIQKQNQ